MFAVHIRVRRGVVAADAPAKGKNPRKPCQGVIPFFAKLTTADEPGVSLQALFLSFTPQHTYLFTHSSLLLSAYLVTSTPPHPEWNDNIWSDDVESEFVFHFLMPMALRFDGLKARMMEARWTKSWIFI